MILPIVAYGDPVLKKKASDISLDHPELKNIISNMYETMYKAEGVGLAAPQVGMSIRLFITDGEPFEDEDVQNFKQVFINPQMIEESGKLWSFNEGCLSIPGIREDVTRNELVKIKFFDENLVEHTKEYSGLAARIIQHEYDHVEGVLFTDKLSPLRKRLLKKKLTDISRGACDVDYRMKFPLKK